MYDNCVVLCLVRLDTRLNQHTLKNSDYFVVHLPSTNNGKMIHWLGLHKSHKKERGVENNKYMRHDVFDYLIQLKCQNRKFIQNQQKKIFSEDGICMCFFFQFKFAC